MGKKKTSIVPDTPRRRSKRLMGRKDNEPSQDLAQDTHESQSLNVSQIAPADMTDGEAQAAILDVADDENMDIEQLAMDVFNNMKTMLVSGRSNKEAAIEEIQSSSGEVMLLEPTERPTKSIKQLVWLCYITH